MQSLGRYRLLVLLLLLASSVGCQSLLKRARWRPPQVTRPLAARRVRASNLAAAESAYAEAVAWEAEGNEACVDSFFQAATLAWPHVEQQLCVHGTPCGRVGELYRSSLTKLISTGTRFCRLDPKRGLKVRTPDGFVTVPTCYHGFPWQPEDFDHLVPVGRYKTKELNQLYRCRGLGVATVAFHCRRPHESFRQQQQVFAATAVLRRSVNHVYSACSPFVLELYDPLRVSSLMAAGNSVSIERDLSASLVYLLSQAEREYVSRFLRPGSSTEDLGLFMIEPYQPGKIPVVFAHGLLSDPFTWANLANEIRARPELLEKYQIWGYEYATGEPFLKSAALLRRQLREVQLQMDPTGLDPALSQMVLVGHSMGGLVSKLQATCSGNQLWESVSCRPLNSIVTSQETRMELAESFYFDPNPSVSRVVFIGTPHRGSPWAGRPIGRLGSRLVDEPSSMEEAHRQLIRDNPNTFSDEFTERIPTSIDLLEPDSPLLLAIDRLPRAEHVRFHSIMGSGYGMWGAGDSDKVVPVSSARQSGVITEKRVRAKHGRIHKTPEGIDELLCILRQHASELNHRSHVGEPIEATASSAHILSN